MTFSRSFVARLLCLTVCLVAATIVIPAAGVDGTWNLLFITEAGDRPVEITLKSDGENVSGPFMNQVMKGTFKDGKLVLLLEDFYSPDAGFKANLQIEGMVADGKIQGTWKFAEYSGPMKGSIGGASATAAALDGTWDFVLITEVGDKPAKIAITTEGETVKGTFGESPVTGTFKDGNLVLKLADFYSPDAGFKADLGLQGTVTGNAIAGKWNFGEYSGPMKGSRAN